MYHEDRLRLSSNKLAEHTWVSMRLLESLDVQIVDQSHAPTCPRLHQAVDNLVEFSHFLLELTVLLGQFLVDLGVDVGH